MAVLEEEAVFCERGTHVGQRKGIEQRGGGAQGNIPPGPLCHWVGCPSGVRSRQGSCLRRVRAKPSFLECNPVKDNRSDFTQSVGRMGGYAGSFPPDIHGKMGSLNLSTVKSMT